MRLLWVDCRLLDAQFTARRRRRQRNEAVSDAFSGGQLRTLHPRGAPAPVRNEFLFRLEPLCAGSEPEASRKPHTSHSHSQSRWACHGGLQGVSALLELFFIPMYLHLVEAFQW